MTWSYLVVGLLALLPLSELAVQVINALVISLLPPDKLPRMDFKSGIPSEHATLVVIPMMLVGEDVVRREIEKLEVRFLGPREPGSESVVQPLRRFHGLGLAVDTLRSDVAAGGEKWHR